MASASGCSEWDSRARISFIKDSSENPLCPSSKKGTMSVTTGFPSVIVQVLSNTIALTLQRFSSGSQPLMRTQYSAHFQVQTIKAVGVASHKAHGQAISITAQKYIKLCSKVAFNARNRTLKVAIAIQITTGTKIAEILSAKP